MNSEPVQLNAGDPIAAAPDAIERAGPEDPSTFPGLVVRKDLTQGLKAERRRSDLCAGVPAGPALRHGRH